MTTDAFQPATIFHGAIVRLLFLQGYARLRRMGRRFCQPRRLLLSIVACLLAGVWLGNAAITVWLREAATPDTLRALLSLGLVCYAAWHFSKAAFFRPESPFEWTPAESDLLSAMPLLPRDLVAYQVSSVAVTTILKAGLFTLLLLPDLRSVPLGFVGLVLMMLALEMLRIAVDVSTWGMGRVAFFVYRVVVVAGLVAAGFAAGTVLVREQAFARINLGEGVLDRLLAVLVQLNASVFGWLATPVKPLIDLTLADSVTAANLRLAVGALAIVVAMALGVICLYATTVGRVVRRERRHYQPSKSVPDSTPGAAAGSRLRIPYCYVPRCGGSGAIAWRQLVGASRHWGSLLTAMIAPAILSCGPLMVIADPTVAFLSTFGTLAFYTFLLLPTALRFDFRRDFERLSILKGLPLSPSAVALGEMVAPVLIATVFQGAVLAVAVFARSIAVENFVVAMLVLIPLNVFIFALDNLIFLLYPYRLQQEGLEIFFRTLLTFTGKGLLFAAGLAAMVAWGFAAASLAHSASRWIGSPVDAYAVYAAGLIGGSGLLALLTLFGLSRTYLRLDPIEDVPQ